MRNLLAWLFIIFLLIIRVVYYYQSLPKYSNATRIRITSDITSEPIRYTKSQYIRLKGYKLYLPLFPEVHYRDNIVVEGVVEDDKLKDVKLVSIEETRGLLFKFRQSLIDFYKRVLPQPESSLIAGVAIGSKSDIPPDFWNKLKRSGTAHVVVASGMNVSLIASFLIGVMVYFLPRRKAIPLAVIGVWLYALIAGFDAPIIRAAIMGSIVFTSQELGRLNSSLRALLISVLVMLFIKPEWITDTGFQLSTFATLALILFEAKIYEGLRFIPERFKVIKRDFSTSLAASIGVAPILYFNFGQFNILSPIINALVLWTIVPMTMIGMISGILGIIFEPIGTIVVWLVYPLTFWFVKIVELFG